MEEKYTKAFKEVYVILNSASEEEINKIPKSFINFIENNMDLNYKPQIEFNENFEKTVLEETLLLLALIYRDYLISKEERSILLQEEIMDKAKESEEYYNVENLFNKRKRDNKEECKKTEQQLIVIAEEKWYKKILDKILSVLKIKRYK